MKENRRRRRRLGLFNSLWLLLVALLLGAPSSSFVAAQEDDEATQPDYFDLLYDDAISNSTTSPWKVVRDGVGENETEYRLGKISIFLPLTANLNGDLVAGMHNDAATALLAVYMWNTRQNNDNNQNDQNRCNIRLTAELWDSHSNRTEVTRVMNENILPKQETVALIGEYESAITSPIAILSGNPNIPLITPASTALPFEDKIPFPLVGRTIAHAFGEANATLELLQGVWNVTHVTVLYLKDPFGISLEAAFSKLNGEMEKPLENVTRVGYSDANGVTQAMKEVKDTKYRTIYVIAPQRMYETILDSAISERIIGPDTKNKYLWLFSSGLDMHVLHQDHLEFRQQQLQQPQQQRRVMASQGIAIMQPVGGGIAPDPYLPGEMRAPPLLLQESTVLTTATTTPFEDFRRDWRTSRENATWIEYLKSKIPLSSVPDYFLEPTTYAPFLYDAIWSLGLSMCEVGAEQDQLDGTAIMDKFKYLDFEGASGKIQINKKTASRAKNDFVVWNWKETNQNNGKQMISYGIYPSLHYRQQEGPEEGWSVVGSNNFVFADSTMTAPQSLPPEEEEPHYVGTTGRVIAYIPMVIIMFCSVFSFLWMCWNRQERAIRSAQPLFLSMISVGSFITVSTIIPMGLDEEWMDDSISPHGLNTACQAVPWLYVIGSCCSYSALTAKVRGVYEAYTNPDLDFVLVSNRDFLNWFLILLTLNVIILTAWTAVAPLEFVRVYEPDLDEFSRKFESYGACANSDSLPYGVVLLVCNIAIVCIGNWWAWQTRNIETEYKESRYVNLSLAFTLQAWLLGIPIMVVVWINAEARYYVSLGVVVITSFASLATIYVPKMIAIRGDRKLKADGDKRQNYLQFSERKKELDVRNDRGYDSDERKETDSLPRKIMTTAIREETSEEVAEGSSNLLNAADIWVNESQKDEISENSAAMNSMYAEKSNSSLLDVPQQEGPMGFPNDIELSEEGEEEGSDHVGEITGSSSISRMHAVHDSIRDKRKARPSSMLGSLGASFAFRSPFFATRSSSFAVQSKEADPQMGGIKIKFNPRSQRNMMLAGGRELSKAQLGHLQTVGESPGAPATTAAERQDVLPTTTTTTTAKRPSTLGSMMEEIAE